MVQYKKSDARAWTRENMKGVANVVIPSYTQDLEKLSEKGIRHDIRTCINYGFWGTLLVSEVAITVDEYTQFVRWSHDEAGGKIKLIHHAGFGTLKENIVAVQAAEKAGADVVLLGYPQNFFATTSQQIYDYTKAFCDATNLGVILFPVPHWGFERIHPAGMDPELVKKIVKDIPNIVCIKAEAGMPTPAGFVEAWKNHAHEVIVTCPLEADAIPFMGFVPMQFSGTSNTGYFGDVVPKMFNFARDGKFDEAMKLYWQIHPARMAQKNAGNSYMPGTSVINRADWKYQNWLAGFNGGPLRQPTMKIVDRNMRILRDGLKKSGLTVTDDPDSEYFVSRNPE
jgi:dihydrodipicolinate synthase/N-acetylneuraminate lyase